MRGAVLCSNLILFFSGKGLYAVGEFAKGENVTVFAGKVGPTSSAKEAFRYPPSPPPSVTLFLVLTFYAF